jgi:hypothetical protein
MQALIFVLGVWCALASLGSSAQNHGARQKLHPAFIIKQPTGNTSSEHWQPFFRGADVQRIPQAGRGGLLKYCRHALNSSFLGLDEAAIGHTRYEHEMAAPVSTLGQLQHAQTLMNACLVQEECFGHTEQHPDPPMSVSAEVCNQTDLLDSLFNKRMMLGRGFNITNLCSADAISTWCNTSTAHDARCRAYQTHTIPQEVPVVAAFANTYITPFGDVFVKDYVFKPVGPCLSQFQAKHAAGDIPRYHEVVVATAFYGHEVYHSLIENLPRLMAVWDELVARPEVMITTGSNKAMTEYLQFMGISRDRVKSGNMHASIAYVPNPGGCGNSPGPRYIQQLRQRMHRALKSRSPDLSDTRDSIVIIQRSRKTRNLHNHAQLVAAVQQRYPQAKVQVFKDNPPPNILEVARMFYSARVIIAPHGAGLSNMVLAQQSATVIEILIKPVVTCFMDLARELGNEYHGVFGNATSQTAPMYANVTEVLELLTPLFANDTSQSAVTV